MVINGFRRADAKCGFQANGKKLRDASPKMPTGSEKR